MRSASFRVVIRHKNVTAWVGCQHVPLVLHWRCQGLAGDRMELVDGQTLRHLIAGKPLEIETVLDVGIVVAGDSAKAKAAYKDFLTLWKHADPDIPILKQRKRSTRSCEAHSSI